MLHSVHLFWIMEFIGGDTILQYFLNWYFEVALTSVLLNVFADVGGSAFYSAQTEGHTQDCSV